MTDALSHQRKQEKLWDSARLFMNQYYGHIEMKNNTKEWIEDWCTQYGWTPRELADELGIKSS
jgi:hypothetical protein